MGMLQHTLPFPDASKEPKQVQRSVNRVTKPTTEEERMLHYIENERLACNLVQFGIKRKLMTPLESRLWEREGMDYIEEEGIEFLNQGKLLTIIRYNLAKRVRALMQPS